MDIHSRNPTLFCAVFGMGSFTIALAYLYMHGLTFSLFVRALAIGFFSGSMVFSILSLLNRASEQKKDGSSMLIALVFISLVVGGSIAIPFFLSNDLGKAAEVLIIVAGLASLLVGHYMERNLKQNH